MKEAGNNIDFLFIVPPYRLIPPFNYKLIDPPRSLVTLATILKRAGFRVEILDMPILGLGYDVIPEYLDTYRPKVVGIQNRSTYSYPITEKTAGCVKQYNDKIPVIAGGTHVSYNPVESMQSCAALDYIMIGEAEHSLPKLLNILLHQADQGGTPEDVEGIAYRAKDGAIKLTAPFIPVEDLSALPHPDLDLIPTHKYLERGERYILDVGRGCLFNCPYCTSEFVKGKMRYRTADHVIEEIREAYNRGFRSFYFFDNMFTANRELVMDICRKIIENKISINWPCMTNIGSVDNETLALMRQAGCDLIAYGIETMSKKALRDIGKQQQVLKIKETFELTRKNGIRPLAFVMFGLPNTTFRDELETIRYISEIKPDAVRAFCFKPFPGTQFFKKSADYGIKIFNMDFYRWSILDEPTHETNDISRDEIVEARLISEYLFRSGGTISSGAKFRRRKGVLIFKTGEGGLLYNPYVVPEKRKSDMYLNGIKLNSLYFEVLYRCDGYHNAEDISVLVQKIFGMPLGEANNSVEAIIREGVERDLLEEIPDVMLGQNNPITSEELGASVSNFVT